jgi:hypothetical protein
MHKVQITASAGDDLLEVFSFSNYYRFDGLTVVVAAILDARATLKLFAKSSMIELAFR